LGEQFLQIYESVGPRDLVQIGILTPVLYIVLRFLGKTRASGLVRGLGLVILGLVLSAQVLIAAFDLTELGRVLDYLLAAVVLGLIVIFQPELRRGLVVLGRYPILRYLQGDSPPIADKIADAADALSRECVGALIAIEREVSLAAHAETGERIDGELSAALVRSIFSSRSPLHDGALIVGQGRISAAACQLPLDQPLEHVSVHLGMRHRAALSLSGETDAVVVVVSEETGRISVASEGKLDPVPRENLSRHLAGLLSSRSHASQAA